MKDLENGLRPFVHRVRLLQGWRGLWWGLGGGGLLALFAAVLDWRGIWFVDFVYFAVFFSLGALLGVVGGLLLRVRPEAIAASLDRRAGLEDRLTAAMRPLDGSPEFTEAVRSEARSRLSELRPGELYPLRVRRGDLLGLLPGLAAACVLTLGSVPLGLTEQERADREALREAAEKVERMIRPLEIDDEGLTDAELQLVAEMRRFAEELKRGRLDRETATQRGNEFAERADALARQRFTNAGRQFASAESAWQRMRESQLTQHGLLGDPELMRLTDEEFARQLADLRSDIAQAREALQQSGLSDAERETLADRLAGLESREDAFEMSRKAREFLERLHADPLYQEIQELARQARAESQNAAQGRPQMTREEFEELMRRLEELADALASDQALKEYLEALKKALEEGKKSGESVGICVGLNEAGLCMSSGQDASGPGSSPFANLPPRSHGRDEQPGAGTTQPVGVRGERQDQGKESYVEIKAPAILGARSSVPYRDVLPQYQSRAEEAIGRSEIPRRHEQRVRDYFDRLNRGGS